MCEVEYLSSPGNWFTIATLPDTSLGKELAIDRARAERRGQGARCRVVATRTGATVFDTGK